MDQQPQQITVPHELVIDQLTRRCAELTLENAQLRAALEHLRTEHPPVIPE